MCVQAFGDFSWTAVKKADITDFEAGVRLGFHQKKKQQAFQRGMFEVHTYLQVDLLLKALFLLTLLTFLASKTLPLKLAIYL